MDGHIGISLGAITAITAIVGAAMAGLGAPWAAWVGFAIWGVLWVIAALGLSDRASRHFLAGTLRKSTFTQIYTALARRNVMAVWSRLCDPAPEDASVPAFFRAALTWRLYDFSLRLAVSYPVLLLVGQWLVTGDEGRVGSFTLLPEADFWPDRGGTLLILLILTGGISAMLLAAAGRRHSVNARKTFGRLFPLAAAIAVVAVLAVVFAVAFAVAVAFTGTLAVSFAVSAAVALTVAVAVSNTGALGVAVATAIAVASTGEVVLAVAVAVAVAVVIGLLDNPNEQRLSRLLLTAAVIGAVLIAAVSMDWAHVSEGQRSLFLFLAVLPLINALFDVVSYALTLSLIRRGLRSGLPFLCGLADMGLACVLLLGLGAMLVPVIHGLNLLAGVPFLDLPALFEGVQADPWAYVWLYLMLFSTLLPTLLHGVLSLLGVQGIWPRVLRRPVAGWVEAAPASPLHALRASFGLSLIWALPLLALAGVLWLIWHYAQPALMAGLQLYLDGLVWIATAPVGAI